MAARPPRGFGGFDLEQDAYNILRRTALLGTVTFGAEELVNIITGKEIFTFANIPPQITSRIIDIVGNAERDIGTPLFNALIAATAGVDLSSAPGRQEANAVQMVERMLGFAVALPFVTAQVHNAVKALLGPHAPESLLKAIEEIPLDLGINFFIGTVIERIFETAVSRPLEEAIAEQKRPARLEWPQIRALARAKALTDGEFRDRLRKAGFREVDLDLITQLDRQLLTIGDLQAAYQFGIRSEGFVRDYLDKIGLSLDDTDLVIDLYLKRAETAGGNQLRAVAQTGFLNSHISEAQYRAYLTMANVPPQSIELEVAASRLVKDWGRVQLNASQVKQLADSGAINDAQTIQRLEGLGYTEGDAIALMNEWHLAKSQGHPGLTESRILAYLKGGVIGPGEAYDRLIALGIRSGDARFLVDHPEAGSQVKTHELSESSILAAMIDGVISQTEAEQRLADRGFDAAEVSVMVRSALVKANRGPKPKQPHKVLSEAQILEAFKLELATDTWAIRELVTAGYSEADAMLLIAIEETRRDKTVPAGWEILV